MKMRWILPRGSRVPSTLTAIALACLALGLGACVRDERVAGGDDIPNAVEPLGKRTAESTRDTTDWNAHGDAPSSAPGVYDSARVPESAPQAGASKRSAAQKAQVLSLFADLGFELAGTARLVTVLPQLDGLLRAVRVQTLPAGPGQPAFRAEDTTWYLADSAGPRLVRVSGFVRAGDDVRHASYVDGDGDGLLSPRSANSLVVIRTLIVRASGEREAEERTLRAGEDKDFNRHADNRVAALRKNVVSGLDTLLSLLLVDADGDGLLYNPFRDSNEVEVTRRSRSGGTQTTLAYRVAIFRDSARNYAHRYRRVVVSAAGVDSVFAFGRDSLPDFAPGDTGYARRVFRPAGAGDTLASTEAWYKVALSAQAGGAGNRLLQVDRAQVFRKGPVTRFTYQMRPTAPVSDGSFARTGDVRARAELDAGGWISFDGKAGAEDILGSILDSEGRTGTVRFGLDGAVKSAAGF